MVNKRIFPNFHLITLCFLAANLMLSGCEPGQTFDPTITPRLTHSNTPVVPPSLLASSTPTPSLPIGSGASIPLSQPINEANISQIQLMASLPENPERMYRISVDHKYLFIADTHGIDVVNLGTQTLEKHLPFGVTYNTLPHGIDPSGINESHFSISASGNILALIDLDGVKVLSLEGEVLFSSALEMPFSPNLSPRAVTTSSSLALSPDGEYLALYRSTTGIEVIRLSDGKSIDTLNLVGGTPRFSPNGTILVTMTNNQLAFWSTADWTKIQEINYKGYWPLFTFASDTTILLHNWSNSLEIWDILHGNRMRSINLEGDPEKSILLAQPLVSPNGEYLAVLKRDTENPCFESSPITVMVFNLNGEKLSEQNTAFKSRNCMPYFLGLAYISSPIMLLDSGEVNTVLPPSNDDPWRTILEEMEPSLAQNTLPPDVEAAFRQEWNDFEYDQVVSPDGSYLALALHKGTGSSMAIFDIAEDEPLYWGSASFTSGNFSPDSSLFTMVLGNTIKLIDLSSNENLQAVTVYDDQRLVPDAPLAISPDRRLLAAVLAEDALSETVGFINIADGTLIQQWPVGNDEIIQLRFSDDGNYLFVQTYGGWIDILGVQP